MQFSILTFAIREKIWFYLVPIALFCYSLPSVAQYGIGDRPNLRFQHLDIDLNSSRIESLLQDSYDYMWIGTLSGLHKYDGVSVTTYLASNDSTSINGNRAGCLLEDSKGRLWVGTENGIAYYNRDTGSFVRIKSSRLGVDAHGQSSNRISSIVEDRDGKIWIASENEGLLFFDHRKGIFVPYLAGTLHKALADTHVISLYFGEDALWIGTTGKGLFRLDITTGEFVHFRHDPANPASLAGNYVEDILIDRKGYLWIATHEDGLDKIYLRDPDHKVVHYRHKPNDRRSLYNDDVTTVYEDTAGRIWICNENGGLHLYNPLGDDFFWYGPDSTDPFSLSNISVKSFYEDRQGRLWVGSNLEGVDVADKYMFRFNHYHQSNDLPGLNNNIVRSFLEDARGNLWIATDGGGLNYFDREKNLFRYYKNDSGDPGSLASNAVLSICPDNAGNLWIGTWRGGINILDRNRSVFRRLHPGTHDLSKVFHLMKDSEGYMWATTQSGGISRVDPVNGTVTTFKNDPRDPRSLGGNDVLYIFEDSRKNIWIATEFNGLNLMRKDGSGKIYFARHVHNATDSTSIISDATNHLFEDSRHNLWIATEGGLSKFVARDSTFVNYTVANGLASNHVRSIIEDDRGMLWLGTAKGLTRFNPENGTFRNYTHNDGLQRGEFSRNSVSKTSRGELVFGGTNGFNIFHPDSIADNPFAPKVYITGFRVFNIPVTVGDKGSSLPKQINEMAELELSYKQSVFSFDFVALNFTHPHMNQYAFKMENFEEDWNYVKNQRTATYTSLDPGEYVFRVKASNNDGLWNEQGKSITIIIRPPFWGTAWFRIGIAIMAVVLVYSGVQYRLRHLRRINNELEKKVNERTALLKELVSDLQARRHEVERANTELKNAHSQLETINDQLDRRVQERTSKLVKANQELDRFVYSASHDLGAPLKSITGLVNILKQSYRDADLVQYLAHIERSVEKLEMIIYHLTQFSRNMGGLVTNTSFIFNDVVEEVLADLKYYSNIHHIHILRDYAVEGQLVSDFMRIKIALTNLLSNAIKYRDVTKPENFIRISFKQQGDFYVIQVEDNGIGIEKDFQEKIFDMFFRATTSSEGAGLGLYIVKDVVEELRGTISLKSEPGIGSVFTVCLPQEMPSKGGGKTSSERSRSNANS